jgi:hypothetical protein
VAEEQGSEPAADEGDLAAKLEAELERMKVSDVLLQTLTLVSSIGFRRLAPATRDLEQARQAIDTMRALVPLLEGRIPVEATRELHQVVASMQLTYASAATETAPAAEPGEDGEADDGGG